ncbi:MAG: phage holin family protein [Myxococcales bacterium]|nr:phage holin family protein [Myxococcales bacterium]
MRGILIHWVTVTAALGVAAYYLDGLHVDNVQALLLGGVALGLVNAIVRPVLKFLTFPLTMASLGLFLLVVNGFAFVLATWFVEGLSVENFWWAIGAWLVVSVVSWVLSLITRMGEGVAKQVRRRSDSSTRRRRAAVVDELDDEDPGTGA